MQEEDALGKAERRLLPGIISLGTAQGQSPEAAAWQR